MRKQYRLRKETKDTLIWDVRRLIRLSQNFKAIDVPLSGVKEPDQVFWFQHSLKLLLWQLGHMSEQIKT